MIRPLLTANYGRDTCKHRFLSSHSDKKRGNIEITSHLRKKRGAFGVPKIREIAKKRVIFWVKTSRFETHKGLI